MPVYEYQCANHGVISELRAIGQRDEPATCGQCGGSALRVISAPRLQLMSADNRRAWERNERSAHEPRRATRAACGHAHHDGGSCSSGQRAGAPAAATLKQGAPGTRPWMLGH